MPNRTIYISDSDLPIFERAQELAGNNLSATIVQALRRFIEMQEQKQEGFKTVNVKVGKHAHTQKQFIGRLLARGRFRGSDKRRYEVIELFQTQKGNIALYTRNLPDWSAWTSAADEDNDWSDGSASQGWADWQGEYNLQVFQSLDQVRESIPEELYAAAEQNLTHGSIEQLDI